MTKPFIPRFGVYLSERFPLAEHGLLIVTFTAGNACVAQAAADPGPVLVGPRLAVAGLVLLLLFFHFRVFDECKDALVDADLQPDRPIQRGVVSLTEIKRAGAVAIAAQAVLALAVLGGAAGVAWLIVLGFSLVMLKEFFVGRWLRPRLFLYAVPHTLSASLIALFVHTAVTGLAPWQASAPMVLYAASAWAGFTVFEVARKAHGPDEEKPGVDSYSSLWGPGGAAAVNLLLIVLTAAGATAAGVLLGMGMVFSVAFMTATAACSVVAVIYTRRPTRSTAKLHYLASSLFLLAHSLLPAILVGLERGFQFTRDL